MSEDKSMQAGRPVARHVAGRARCIVRTLLVMAGCTLSIPFWCASRAAYALGLGDRVFVACGQLLCLVPGSLGINLRRGYYWMTCEDLSTDCGIGFGSWFSYPQVLTDRPVPIGAFCTHGMCEIGEATLAGSNADVGVKAIMGTRSVGISRRSPACVAAEHPTYGKRSSGEMDRSTEPRGDVAWGCVE